MSCPPVWTDRRQTHNFGHFSVVSLLLGVDGTLNTVYYLRFLWIDFHSLSDVSRSGQDPLVVAVCGTSETIKCDPGSAAGTRRMLVKAY